LKPIYLSQCYKPFWAHVVSCSIKVLVEKAPLLTGSHQDWPFISDRFQIQSQTAFRLGARGTKVGREFKAFLTMSCPNVIRCDKEWKRLVRSSERTCASLARVRISRSRASSSVVDCSLPDSMGSSEIRLGLSFIGLDLAEQE
jgi:hypothetical protein